MALRLISQQISKSLFRNTKLVTVLNATGNNSQRCMSHYPIDESIFGLTEEQQQVFFFCIIFN